MKDNIRELRTSAVMNAVREYVDLCKKRLQAYNSIFTKENYGENDEMLTTFAVYFAGRVNAKLGTSISSEDVEEWYCIEKFPFGYYEGLRVTIGAISSLTLTEQLEWLSSIDNRPTTAVL